MMCRSTFCSHISNACLRRNDFCWAIEEVQNYEKIVFMKNIVENGWWGMHSAYPTCSPGSATGWFVIPLGIR